MREQREVEGLMRKWPADEMGEENKVNGMAMEYKLNKRVEEIDYLEIRKDSWHNSKDHITDVWKLFFLQDMCLGVDFLSPVWRRWCTCSRDVKNYTMGSSN